MVTYNQPQKQPGAYLSYMVANSTIAAVIIAIVLFISAGMDGAAAGFALMGGGVIFVLAALVGWLSYAVTSFTAGEQNITLNTGIIVRSQKTIDYSRVQNVNNTRGPLQMLFGLSTVNIWTASQDQLQTSTSWNNGVATTSTRARPEGKLVLLRADADELRSRISNRGAIQQVTVMQPTQQL